MFAEAWGVSVDDVRKQLAAQDAAGRLQAALLAAEGDVFGGLWIDHEPSFQIVVRALPGSEARILPYIDQEGLTDVSRIEVAQYTFEQLEKDQASLNALAPAGVNFASGISVSLGRLEVWVDNTSDAAALEASGLPNSTVVLIGGQSRPVVQIYGGLEVDNLPNSEFCTSGFGVDEINGTREGVTTAGHCRDSESYQGVDLPWQAGQKSGRTDAQWHTTPGFDDVNKIRVTSSGTTRNVTSRMNHSNMTEGAGVCKYGTTTFFDCGTINVVNYQPSTACVDNPTATYMVATPNPQAGDMAEPGDSGGPVFLDDPAKAWGQNVCDIEPGGDMIFMPQDYLADVGVRVKIS